MTIKQLINRGVDPYGTGGTCPPIFIKGDVHGNVPPNILEVISFRLGVFYPVTAKTVVCCILMQILCVVSQKKLQLLGGTRPPTGALPLDALGDFCPQTSSLLLCPPNNPLRSTPLLTIYQPIDWLAGKTVSEMTYLGG